MKKHRVQKAAAAISVTALCLSISLGAYAAWQKSVSTTNVLTMSGYKNEIVEEYEEPDHVDPSQEVSKIVNVSNTGQVDTLVRVSVTKAFGTENEDGEFEEDETLDPEMILIEFNSAYWMEKEGYYYYTEILKAGETTKEPLMESYTLSAEAGNEYRGREARIIVQMESVQAEGGALSVWGLEYKDLGITAPSAGTFGDTEVTFNGKETGFTLSVSDTDLFANFKDLLPGCARTQNIQIRNASDDTVEIFLRAQAADQDSMSEEQLALVRELLEKYAVIEVSMGDRIIYTGPVSGNLEGSGSSMKSDVSLGSYAAGEDRELTVKLSLDPRMDNQYMSLTGKVIWVFFAGGEDAVSDSIYPAKTGLNNSLGKYIVLFLLAVSLWAVSFAFDKYSSKAE